MLEATFLQWRLLLLLSGAAGGRKTIKTTHIIKRIKITLTCHSDGHRLASLLRSWTPAAQCAGSQMPTPALLSCWEYYSQHERSTGIGLSSFVCRSDSSWKPVVRHSWVGET